ncbi:hypothetical protein DdX_17033 [Ditylenchus destructor]|uniref:Uncharacterized protein n=1 Tax=Ditylenchus destructor TaxID=166010 RepID=A0AAD4MM40_9BILA|nr:hypothetical protein DdX_17031 [Ditylenchus destructor]KAI1699940.1 hypothetical protein DdX_17033 [Ditylenchus destructor]
MELLIYSLLALMLVQRATTEFTGRESDDPKAWAREQHYRRTGMRLKDEVVQNEDERNREIAAYRTMSLPSCSKTCANDERFSHKYLVWCKVKGSEHYDILPCNPECNVGETRDGTVYLGEGTENVHEGVVDIGTGNENTESPPRESLFNRLTKSDELVDGRFRLSAECESCYFATDKQTNKTVVIKLQSAESSPDQKRLSLIYHELENVDGFRKESLPKGSFMFQGEQIVYLVLPGIFKGDEETN